MTTPRIIYYYQTLTSLQPIISVSGVTHINLAAIHFGYDDTNQAYIHLNDYSPYHSKFDSVWKELSRACQNNIEVRLMIGGAGSAFQKLFSNFEVFYPMLVELLRKKSNIIQGVDLDVEEMVELSDIEMLISRLKKDMGQNFKITMAPIQEALQNNNPGLGGFVYQDLLHSSIGKEIEFFNGQFYSDYSLESYDEVVKNGFESNKVVMGMIAGGNMSNNFEELKKVYQKYGSELAGVFIWEYALAPANWLEECLTIFQ